MESEVLAMNLSLVLTAAALLLLMPRLASSFPVCVQANNLGGYPLCAPGDEMSYNGEDIEVFKYAAGLAGWSYSNTAAGLAAPASNRTWSWSCNLVLTSPVGVPWMLNASMYSTCAILLGGIAVTTARIGAGVNFGYVYDNSTGQMTIYDSSSTSSVDIWSFIRPFAGSLWIAFVLSLVVIPPSIWLVEQLSQNGMIVLNRITMEDLSQSLYRNILTIFGQDVMYVGSFGGQIVMLAFLFMILIVISTYTANLAAFNTVTAPGPTYHTLMDFAGKRILIQNPYANLIQGLYPTLNVTIAPASFSPLNQLLALRAGEYDVLFIAANIVNLNIMALQDCNFKLVGQGIDSPAGVVVFHSLFPSDIKAEYNSAIIEMAVNGELEPIYKETPVPACSAPSNLPVVQFHQVLGLWIVLCSVCGFGLFCAAVSFGVRYISGIRKAARVPSGGPSASHVKGGGDSVNSVKGKGSSL